MAEKYGSKTTFFANSATAYIQKGGDTYTFGVLRDLEFTVAWEHVPLYGMSSIVREAVAKHSAKVDIKVKFGKFDPTLANDFIGAIINPDTPTAGTMQDTNKVTDSFIIVAGVDNPAGTISFNIRATGVYFESVPVLTLTENEWVMRDFTAVGKNIVLDNA